MHLVNQLLDISKLDAGKMKITLSDEDIVKCLRILVYEFLSQAESKHIKYIADLPEEDFVILFDRDKTEKIISNILSNAFKYTPQNGNVQCIIKIKRDKDKNSQPVLLVRVVDSGPGISKEHQDRIFDRFYRVEGHNEADGYGTGIGLSLVNEFVSLLHGEITVKSSPGTGSDFTVTLPLGIEHLSSDEYLIIKPSTEIAVKKEMEFWKGKYNSAMIKNAEKGRMKILIIEDNEDLRNYIRETLSNDYLVLEAENGKAGINLAFTMMPDLIVTDIMIPDFDGLMLCTQLKNDIRTSHIPIIMLTAKATTQDRIAGLKSGADDYIVKPFNMTELITRISNLLAARDRLRLKYSKFHLLETEISPTESVDDRFIARVVSIINSNLNDFRFDVGLLHELLGISKTHLTRKLKILTGLSAGILIRNIRLEKGAELLRRKSGNITEIANSVGISNPSGFTKSFRKYFGVAPKDYVKQR
jgi:CheY-like chemotaxis protein